MSKEVGEKRVLFLTDIHAPYHSQNALDTAIDFSLSKDIDEVIVSELPDMYRVSSWGKDPNTAPFFRELEDVQRVVHYISTAFRGKKITYLVGNHEERIINYLRRRAPELCGVYGLSISEIIGIDQVGWDYTDNRERLMHGESPLAVGKLSVLHGHEIRMGWGAVNIAKIMYERCRTNVICGHFHRAQEWVVRLIDGTHEGCWTVGCLCDLNPEYMPHNDWVNGFAIIHSYGDGTFSIENRKIIRGKVL